MFVWPRGLFRVFLLVGLIVSARRGMWLGFAFAGPLKIQIWRLPESHLKTCQNKLNFWLFNAFVWRRCLFKAFSWLGFIVWARWGVGLGFAFAGPLKIRIWRPPKSHLKT